ncbi:MAG: hypothetical protein H6772_05205 [Pseudomonadales bacterium]|nr:hypothetical protein [Candidatus Woesebacteria bacterium]MCB9813766.1 hypothetical protein [Pseudomonadales bacterium]
MFVYLQEYSHYEDLYDLHTIEECLDWYWRLRKGMEQHRGELKAKEPETNFDKEVHKCCSYTVNVIKIERYRHKKDRISEWMEADRKRQEKIDNAKAPDGILCDKCHSPTKVIEKTLHDAYDDNMQVSFMFECLKCQKRQIFYEDGSPWDFERPRCKDCDANLETKYDKKGEKLTIITYCPKCSFKEIDVIDSKKKRIAREKEEQRQLKLLEEYRSEFCLNDEDGPKAITSLDGIVYLVKEWKKQEKKEKDPVFQKAKKLKKLKLKQLKDLVSKVISDVGYTDLEFSKPEMGKFVIVEFSATDNKEEREEYDSTHVIKKAIKSVLETTNWRLMSEGIHYRLGIVSGRLKAYEQEDDLMSLVSNDYEK